MEAIGERGAKSPVGTNVSGPGAAALLRGRRLRSIPAAPLSDAPVKDVSDGGAGAGPATPHSATNGPVSAAIASGELASSALAMPDLKASLAFEG